MACEDIGLMFMRVVAVSIGRPNLHLRDGRPYSTAIDRRPQEGALEVTLEGLAGDRVSDSKNHGGPDKALCCYPEEHYPYWRERLAAEALTPALSLKGRWGAAMPI